MLTVQKEGIILEKTNREFESHDEMNLAPFSTKGGWSSKSNCLATDLPWSGRYPSEIVYSDCNAALKDLNNPGARSSHGCTTSWVNQKSNKEKKGESKDVVFSTGTAQFGDTLNIYYVAANERLVMASVNLPDQVEELQNRW